MKNYILKIGRNPFYPYVCILIVTLVFLSTNPINNFSWRYTLSFFGAICGLICVMLLAKGRNSGNILGMCAAFGESSGNYLGGNIGAALPSIYYFITHIFGLINWKKHQTKNNQVEVRSLKEIHFIYIILFIILASLLNVYLTSVFDVINDPYQQTINNFCFALGVVAQFIMIQRYAANWNLWILLNCLAIGLNIYTNNPIIVAQYTIYLFNAVYGLAEWRLVNKTTESTNTLR